MRESILVTGGAGFIGSHVVDRLLAGGADVIIVDSFDDFYDPSTKRMNIAPALATGRCQLVEKDIRDLDGIAGALGARRIDAIVHLAARAGVRPSIDRPLLYTSVNVDGTVAMLELARRSEVRRFIFGSSSSVYGNNVKTPFGEGDAVDRPISPYAATKRAGELLCHTFHHLHGISVACLRFFTVYGPRQRPDLAIHKFARLILEGSAIPIFGDGSMRRDFTFIDDTVSAVVATLAWTRERGSFEIMNVGAGGAVSVLEMVESLARALDRTPRIDWQDLQPGDVNITIADTTKAERVLGFRAATPFAAGVRQFADWFVKMEEHRRRREV